MLEWAPETADRGNHLNNYGGDFYNFTSQLKRSHERGNSRHIGRSFDRNGQEKKRRPRKMSKREVVHDVFLGGSCNPTTWRKDVAIPLLDSLGITYFNPQVAEWSAELVAVEHAAKERASILLYVLDRRTRNVVGIVEAANFAGSGRHLALVTDPYRPGEPVANENITQTEYEELCSGLATLQDLVTLQGIPVYSSIPDAIKWTVKVLNNRNSSIRNIGSSIGRNSWIKEDELLKYKTFNGVNKQRKDEKNHSNERRLSYCLLGNNKNITDLNGTSSQGDNCLNKKANYEPICGMVGDWRPDRSCTSQRCGLCGSKSLTDISISADSLSYDIYIGGSCSDPSWREKEALPLLRESRLKWWLSENGPLKESLASQREVVKMQASSVLLFVITSTVRGLETMVLASYYIGCGRNVVLCIQNLTESSVVNGEKLSKTAASDYNRGRVYLSDLAHKSTVAVFDNVSQAVKASVGVALLSQKSRR